MVWAPDGDVGGDGGLVDEAARVRRQCSAHRRVTLGRSLCVMGAVVYVTEEGVFQ